MEINLDNKFIISNQANLSLIGGPCQIENLDHSLFLAEKISKICKKLNINFIFKGSFDKANRTSLDSKRGIGIDKVLEIFSKVKTNIGCPTITDIHEPHQAQIVSEFVDIIQIPALLCRQTDLIQSASKYCKIINIKKGQFAKHEDVKYMVNKSIHNNVIMTERGNVFGYDRLIVDMKGFDIMKKATNGLPVFFDATHSTQEPSSLNGSSGGKRYFAPILARAAIASTNIAGIFAEIHEDPDNAPSDGPCMMRLDTLEKELKILKQFNDISRDTLK